MKATDKIVTSITLPQQTNVLWHNPETGELKMFGNKGWELVGGGKLPEIVPEIVESGWVLDKETGGIAVKVGDEKPNTCSYVSSYGPDWEGWKFADNPTLSAGESIELTEVGTDNIITVVVIGIVGGPYSGYKFEGDLDTSKTYSYGTYLSGLNNTASAKGAVASGNKCIASGQSSHAEGSYTTASGDYSHAEGSYTTASGDYSHAEGSYTTASGDYSHAEGNNTAASGGLSHAEGQGTNASGGLSHAEGDHTTASSEFQHVQGKYNIDDPDGTYQFIIGNGDVVSPSNAFAVKWDGTIVMWNNGTALELTPSKLEALLALV